MTGKLIYREAERVWVLDRLQPHEILRLKAVFPKIEKTRKQPFIFKDTLENAVDLAWFETRYQLEMSALDRMTLQNMCNAHKGERLRLEQIFTGDYTPPLNPGLREIDPRNGKKNEIRPSQRQAVNVLSQSRGLLLADEVGLGKAQPLDAMILTPGGFVPMGDIKVGSVVISADGTATPVTGVYPQGKKRVYRVTFKDGSSTECCEDHLWQVISRDVTISRKGTRTPRRERIMTTAALAADLTTGTKGQRLKWQVPIMAAPNLDNGQDRPIDPYVLGVLLGDGCFRGKGITVSTIDQFIVHELNRLLPPGLKLRKRSGDNCDYGITSGQNGGRVPNKLKDAIVSLGLFGKSGLEKSIPAAYLNAPVADRVSMLQGLMDTDGYAMPLKNGCTAQFYSSSHDLVKDVEWLVRSLGGVCSLTSKFFKGRDRYTVTIKAPEGILPFRLPRKAAIWGEGHKTYEPRRFVVKIEDTGIDKPMQCIAVAHPSHLYVTDDFVVTHNTFSAAASMLLPGALPCAVVCYRNLQRQWKTVIEAFTTLRVCEISKTKVHSVPEADVYIFSYTQLGGWADHFGQLKLKAVFWDEVQDLRTGTETGKGRGAIRLRDECIYRMGLSATPIYNYGTEIWNIMQFINPDLLGPHDDFRREWAPTGHIADPDALSSYMKEKGAFLRRTKRDVGQESAPVNKIVQEIGFDAETIKDAEKLARQLAIQATSGAFTERGRAAMELDAKMRQATGIAKAKGIATFARIVVESGQKVIIGLWHREVYAIIMKELEDLRPQMYTGSESVTQKRTAGETFMKPFDEGGSDILLMSVRSGAGLDGLQTVCSTVIIGELDWSPGVIHQLIGRLDREGQTEPVNAFYLTVDEGSDPILMDINGLKLAEQSALIDSGLGVQAVVSDGSALQKLVQKYLPK